MLAEFHTKAVWESTVFGGIALLIVVICLSATICRWEGWGFGFLGILSGLLFGVLAVLIGWTDVLPEVAPGVVVNHRLDDKLYWIGQDVPTVYENGSPQNSGCQLRWWQWKRVICVGDNIYDRRVARRDTVLYRTNSQAATVGEIVSLSKDIKDIKAVTINGGTDAFWRHDHYGEPQPGFEMLVRPKSGDARIEKWVFN